MTTVANTNAEVSQGAPARQASEEASLDERHLYRRGFESLNDQNLVDARKKLFGYKTILYTAWAVGVLSFVVWANSGCRPERTRARGPSGYRRRC